MAVDAYENIRILTRRHEEALAAAFAARTPHHRNKMIRKTEVLQTQLYEAIQSVLADEIANADSPEAADDLRFLRDVAARLPPPGS